MTTAPRTTTAAPAPAEPPAPAVPGYVPPAAPPARRPSPLWGVAAGTLLLVSFSLITEMARRFIGSKPDGLSVTGVVLQVGLAAGAAATLTKIGDAQLGRLLRRLGIKDEAHHVWKVALAAAVLLVVIGVNRLMPIVARYYNDRGVELQADGNLLDAIEHYERAIRLKPDYAEAHYNLATAQEDALEYDKAIGAYQLALRADLAFYSPANNLARIYLLRKADHTSALEILDNAIEKLEEERRTFALVAEPDPRRLAYLRQTEYTLRKNRGWAYLNLGHVAQAEEDLNDALALREDGAAAHCLRAQVKEARAKLSPGATDDAIEDWEACVALRDRGASGDTVEAGWLATARERLKGREGK